MDLRFLRIPLLSSAAIAIACLLMSSVPSPAFQSKPREQRPGVTPYPQQLEQQYKTHPTLQIGDPAPDFSLPGTDGKIHTLSEFSDSPVLVVMFLSNHCPASQLYDDRAKKLVADYRPKGVAFVAIQPNSPAAIWPSQLNYTDVDDSLEGMKIRAEYQKYNFPYLYDGDTQAVAHKYGPKVTPHLFVFDRERKLRYEGRFDDNMNEASVKVHDARNALDALIAGRPLSVEHTPVSGCATKWLSWKEQRESLRTELQDWQDKPVTLEKATAEDLKKLRANATDKVVMVNFWATWCGPCVAEFPELLKTHIWYNNRDFELVTVSVDVPPARPAVLKFLEKQHSAVRNLQFATDDYYGLQAAFDPKWQSGVPFTIVIAPGGETIYWQEGEISLLPLRRAILGNLPDGSFIGAAEYWRVKP